MPSHPSPQPAPRWSVMIPTYEPTCAYLQETLHSILAQDPGPQAMEIHVFDDASPTTDVGALVSAIAGDRVRFSRHPQNGGLAANWNACIAAASGDWVHIVHQDDIILPGFYDAIDVIASWHPDLLAIYTRHAYIDAVGEPIDYSPAEQIAPGPFSDFLHRIFTQQIVQCPSIAVRRSTYELVGPYTSELCYTLDWDMWKRIAAAGPVGYCPSVLACYRTHDRSETARLGRLNAHFPDLLQSIKRSSAYLPAHQSKPLTSLAYQNAIATEIGLGWRLLLSGNPRSSLRTVLRLLPLAPSNPHLWKLAAGVVRSFLLPQSSPPQQNRLAA